METEICGCDLIAAGGRRHGMNLKERHELHAAIICCEHKAAPAGSSRKLARGNRVNISSSKPPGDRRWPLQIRLSLPRVSIRTLSPMTGRGEGHHQWGVGGGGHRIRQESLSCQDQAWHLHQGRCNNSVNDRWPGNYLAAVLIVD